MPTEQSNERWHPPENAQKANRCYSSTAGRRTKLTPYFITKLISSRIHPPGHAHNKRNNARKGKEDEKAVTKDAGCHYALVVDRRLYRYERRTRKPCCFFSPVKSFCNIKQAPTQDSSEWMNQSSWTIYCRSVRSRRAAPPPWLSTHSSCARYPLPVVSVPHDGRPHSPAPCVRANHDTFVVGIARDGYFAMGGWRSIHTGRLWDMRSEMMIRVGQN
jgi:hypothetical protein